MSNYRVLICDDNEIVHQSLSIYLEAEGIASDSVYDGETALKKVRNGKYDLIILDIMMPKLFGTEVCKEIRKFSEIPIIFLSAKGEEFDRILGLELGADDYVTKPFSAKEVAVRVKSILRRANSRSSSDLISIGNISINKKAYLVSIKGTPLKMTAKEVELLAFLAEHKNEVVSRDDILNNVWGENYFGDFRAVDTLIARIRGKLSTTPSNTVFRTIYGVGYSIEEKNE